ncbi:MAG TPA: type III pantothenate kinase [Bacilli bacterium]|nr:MAG: Type III pantothenate kinase [Tenericutes bacterium ADurb.BinA124]HNZ50295.1 type III pantothenate kinase [Bacilli bacterium]HPN61129.1 type III pantothenate kinase [Bacilli bacterium]HPX83654.1 type III pantothenate kinase [Bacilli bacterium]HQC74275.1 type III pantothenate kinase [Bacilli bacterium]
MLLCVDIGNTNIVLGVFQDDNLSHSFRLQCNLMQTADEYGTQIIEILRFYQIDYLSVKAVIISSVVPGLDRTFEKMAELYFKTKPLFVGPGTKSGIKIKLDNPKQLGADILVGAVAAYYKYGAPAIIIDMGTAITFAYVNAEKELLGGIIVPGIKTSFSNLVSKTSKLEEVRMDVPLRVIGRDTVASIQSGMIYGTASMIDGMIRKIKQDVNVDRAVVVITGGEARMIMPFLEEKIIYDDHLLLDGLRLIYQKNQ